MPFERLAVWWEVEPQHGSEVRVLESGWWSVPEGTRSPAVVSAEGLEGRRGLCWSHSVGRAGG